jgi:ABC-type transporter Mla subunit MlaD
MALSHALLAAGRGENPDEGGGVLIIVGVVLAVVVVVAVAAVLLARSRRLRGEPASRGSHAEGDVGRISPGKPPNP